MDIYKAGQQLLCGGYTQYTPSGKANFVRAGRYGKTPQLGDAVYFYHESQGRVAHVGAVIELEEPDYYHRKISFKAVEGNSSPKEWDRNGGMVSIKTYDSIPMESIGSRKGICIDGFGHPRFGADTCSVSDFINALKGEVGYIEKASKAGIGALDRMATPEEKAANRGTANFTKYGAWYGMNGVAWCQQFVSWCAFLACKEAAKGGWYQDADGKWRYRQAGVDVKGRWLNIDGRWYVFDGAGYMISEWFKDSGGAWYYLNPEDGAMVGSQWVKTDGKWYYLDSSGVMAESAYVYDNAHKAWCHVGPDGSWDGAYMENPGPGAEIAK